MKKEKIKKLLPFAAEILKNANIRTILSPSEQEQAERIVRIFAIQRVRFASAKNHFAAGKRHVLENNSAECQSVPLASAAAV